MNQQTIDLVRNSGAHVSWHSAKLMSNFNIHLFNISPEVQTAQAQGRFHHLRGMLCFFGFAAEMLGDLPSLNNLVDQIGKRHGGYGAVPAHYPVIGEALLLTLGTELQDLFTPEVKAAWAAFYLHMSERMLRVAPAGEGHVDRAMDDNALYIQDVLEAPDLHELSIFLPFTAHN